MIFTSHYDHWQYWEWLLLKVFTQPFYGLNELLQGITSYLSWLWSHLLMYLPRKPFSPMSNGFERSCRKKYVIILCFFAKNPYLKTNGACHLILFSVKDPKQDSMSNSYMIFLHNCSKNDFRLWAFLLQNQAQNQLSHTYQKNDTIYWISWSLKHKDYSLLIPHHRI